jgi:hypothetical protein
VLSASEQRILGLLSDSDVVLDIGAWANPFARADWVIDLLPYETRGSYGAADPERERFGPERWIQRDVCDPEPLPFGDGEIDFAICSQTLEDLRDPLRVCRELMRVARAGYIEVPSRLQEQAWGVIGPYVGWSHHRWICDVGADSIQFVFKPHVIHANERFHFPRGFAGILTPEERVQTLFWEDGFSFGERIFHDAETLDDYLESFVIHQSAAFAERVAARPSRGRVRGSLARLRKLL